jgi:Predicted membrane protein
MIMRSRWLRLDLLGVSLAVFLATALAFFRLGSESIWLDEGMSIEIARNWPHMWQVLPDYQANMWLYYILLHFWLKLGLSEFLVRIPSAVFAIATVPVSYVLGVRLFGSRVAIITAFMLAVNVFFIHYAQEARSYSLLLFLVTLSSFLFVKCIERPSLSLWVGYIVSSVLAIYAHFFGALAIGAQAISLVFLRPRDIPWRGAVSSYLTIALLLLPALLFALSHGTGNIDWIERPTAMKLYKTLKALAGGAPTLVLVYIPLCLVAFISVVQISRRVKSGLETWRYAFPLIWLLAPLVVAFSFSSLGKPIFISRYLILCLPPFVLLTALGLSTLRKQWLVIAFLTIFLGSSGRSLVKFYMEQDKENWRGATSFVLSEAKPGDAVLFYAYFVRFPFEYYIERFNEPNNYPTLLELAPAPDAPRGGSDLPAPDQGFLESLPSKHGRVWLILSHDNPRLGRDVESRLIQNSLSRNYGVAREHNFQGVRVLLYDMIVISQGDV